MTRAILVAVLMLLPCVATTEARAEGWTKEKTARVDKMVAPFVGESVDNKHAPSVALAVGVDGQLLLAKGYGEARAGVKANSQTTYQIGSITKQITAAVVLKLISEGAISRANGHPVELDTPLRDLFFGVDHWHGDDRRPVTIRRLLTMTSNLPNFTRRPPDELDPWGAIKAPHLFEAIKRYEPIGWPESFEYSNTGYFLLSQIIEAVKLPGETRSHSYWARVRKFVLEPAGMSETTRAADNANPASLAHPHYDRRPAFTQPDWLKGSGDFVSNLTDVFKWNKALMSGVILKSQIRAEMFSEAARVGPHHWYGMGWFVRPDAKRTTYFHSGSVPGYTSLNMIVRENDTRRWASVIILTNATEVQALDDLARRIARQALDP